MHPRVIVKNREKFAFFQKELTRLLSAINYTEQRCDDFLSAKNLKKYPGFGNEVDNFLGALIKNLEDIFTPKNVEELEKSKDGVEPLVKELAYLFVFIWSYHKLSEREASAIFLKDWVTFPLEQYFLEAKDLLLSLESFFTKRRLLTVYGLFTTYLPEQEEKINGDFKNCKITNSALILKALQDKDTIVNPSKENQEMLDVDVQEAKRNNAINNKPIRILPVKGDRKFGFLKSSAAVLPLDLSKTTTLPPIKEESLNHRKMSL